MLLFLNNWGAWQVTTWLRQRGEDIVGLVLQPPDDQRFADEIRSAVGLPADHVWTADQLRDPTTIAQLRALRPDIGISAFFGYILKADVIQLFPNGCVNLHAALLPYNRGWHTNVWPIIDGSPAGVTIHYIDAGVDTGDIIAQRRLPVEPTDTGGSLHERITRAQVDLFRETWPLILEGKNSRAPQDHSIATLHRKAELAEVSRIHLDQAYRAGNLVDILRARTYPPYPSAYYEEGGQRTYLRVELFRGDQLNESDVPQSTRRTFPRIDLDAEYGAKDLLGLLSAPGQFVELIHESGPILARSHIVFEREFNPAGSPPWMADPRRVQPSQGG